ncbi:MAG: hypothetical protein ACI9BD_000669, partial [Candidatus Marinamargulisbacteria bacterium]
MKLEDLGYNDKVESLLKAGPLAEWLPARVIL